MVDETRVGGKSCGENGGAGWYGRAGDGVGLLDRERGVLSYQLSVLSEKKREIRYQRSGNQKRGSIRVKSLRKGTKITQRRRVRRGRGTQDPGTKAVPGAPTE
jgi:hypothetical protein